MGWGDPSGTKWSDLNGTYVRTSVAVRPSAYTDGNQGMHTPASGTYNYYLSNPISMGSPNAAWNGIAYFLAPGNRSGWGDPNNDGQTDPPVNYWRLCVLDDWPFTYFTNPSSDPYTFPTTGWVPVSASAPTPNEGAGYNGADYLGNYSGGFSVAASGGSSTLSSSALTITGVDGSTVVSVAGLTLPNATHVRVGSFDNSTGGQGGISLVCAVGNELNWQGGRLRNVQVGGDGSPQPITSDSAIIFPGDGVSDVEIGAAGLTFSDGSAQTVAWTGSMSYNDLNDLPTLFDGSYNSLSDVPTLFDGSYNSLSDVPASFEPSSHKSSHATGGSDALSAADLAYTPDGPNVDATDVQAAISQLDSLSENYVLYYQYASDTTAGVVKVGGGLAINGSGVISLGDVSSIKTANGDTFYAYTTDGQLTWSTTPPSPPSASVSLLLHFDGNFDDSSPNALTVTADGGVAISTTESRFGGASAYFDGSSGLVISSDEADVYSGDFTIECWARPGSLTGIHSIVGKWSNPLAWLLALVANDPNAEVGNALVLYWSEPGEFKVNSVSKSFDYDTWYHIAATRAGSIIRIFVDGDLLGTFTDLSDVSSQAGNITIGFAGSDGHYFNGYIDELRIVKGLAVYTGPFTPPTEPLTTIATPYA
jgi:hypothetical protein